jgi:hypothetical protein
MAQCTVAQVLRCPVIGLGLEGQVIGSGAAARLNHPHALGRGSDPNPMAYLCAVR